MSREMRLAGGSPRGFVQQLKSTTSQEIPCAIYSSQATKDTLRRVTRAPLTARVRMTAGNEDRPNGVCGTTLGLGVLGAGARGRLLHGALACTPQAFV